MPTIFQRLQWYESIPGSTPLSNKKKKKLYNWCKGKYDKNKQNPPISYVQSEENGDVFTVRNYPDSFIPSIDAIIFVLAGKYNKTSSPPPLILSRKKERKKIPVKPKPAYSSRKT